MPIRSEFKRAADLLWLAALVLYIVAGMPLASFHGDEAMQIYMSRDYAAAFFDGDRAYLTAGPPYFIDSDPQLRILNGSINRYTIGLGWHLAGFSRDDLPTAPGWDWGLDYNTNVETGRRPADGLLWAARASSALFLALSAWAIFTLAYGIAGRPAAYVASALYALNPVILLNGRRAMMEGSMLLFGLLAVLVAALIAARLARRERLPLYAWGALAAAAGLALVSKHTGAIFAAAAFGWVGIAALIHLPVRRVLETVAGLVAAGLVALALFVALSPALWSDPPARLADLVAVRAELIDIQVTADPAAPLPLADRLAALMTQPFMAAPAHYEAGGWTSFEPIAAEVARYMASPLSGVQFGPVGGAAVTLLARVGALLLLSPRGRGPVAPGMAAGILLWMAVTVAALLLNPLPWQRYYLPLIPVLALLAGVAAARLIQLIRRRD